jgi:predicted RNA-binding Zn-ribbon protein involved in translation (DUF1610 family)
MRGYDSKQGAQPRTDYERLHFSRKTLLDIMELFMAFPIKTCVKCGEEFELKPGKPGFANRCPDCSEEESATGDAGRGEANRELNAARRDAMKNLLYRKDS